MPKFSAYMRGEEGPQGDVGQAVLLNGIVSSSSELPPNTENQKNLVYYVGNDENEYHLWVYTTTEQQWQDLGSIKGTKGDTGLAAGFSLQQNAEIYAVNPDAEPQINIVPDPNSPDTAKIFNFTFGIPRGQNAGFGQNHIATIRNVNTIEEAYVYVSTDENSPNTAKNFDFEFGIPRGEAADFGDPTASISTISSLSTASVSITSSGSATSKIFDFHFDIPQGPKGDRGDSFSIYEPIAFTTGSEYWVDNTTFVYPRGDNSKLPIYIYNEDTDELDNSSFTFTDTDIVYNSEQPFNGTLYLMAGANRPTINIGEISTTSFDGQMSASLNERSTSSDAIIDFILKSGPQGEQGESAGFGEPTVSASTIEADQPASVSISTDGSATSKIFNFHFDIPRGYTGDSLAIYEGISFSTDSSYWNGSTFIISQGSNHKIPLYIYDNDHNSLAATFNVANGIIKYEADEPFNGTIYLASQTARSTLRIGNVSSTTYGNGSYFSLNPESTSTDAVFDVVLEQGPRGETALSAQVGRVSYTSGIPNVEIEGEQELIFNFDLPRGFKGDKGDTFTVDVDETIDLLNYNESPIVETTSTSTGIALKFKLPPSVAGNVGDLSQLNFVSLTTDYVKGILPVGKGGTGLNSFNTNAILLGNNTAIKQKVTSAGAFYATATNGEPGFGVLPISYGGTGGTTFTANSILLGNDISALKTKATANGAFYATSANGEPNFGILPIAQGGTEATDPATARAKLGAAAADHVHNYLSLTGGTLSGDLLFSDSGTGIRQIRLTCGTNDQGRIAVGATAANAGWMEIATADDATEPIYVRQYTGTYATVARTLTLLDANGHTILPGALEVYSGFGQSTQIKLSKETITVQSKSVIRTGLDIYSQTYGNDATQLKSNTAGVLSYGDGGPQIRFAAFPNATQNGTIIFTDNDSVAPGASWSFVTDQGDTYVISKHFKGDLVGTASGNLPLIGGTLTGILTLHREGTTVNNYPSGIAFSNKDTTTGSSTGNAHIYAYHDHANPSYGMNLVISPAGNLFIGSGESADNHYALYTTNGNENMYLTSDGTIDIQANGQAIANRVGVRIDTGGNLIPVKADVITNNIGSIGTNSYRWNSMYATSFNGTTLNANNIEFSRVASNANNGGFIDFHYNGSSADYTARIIETADGISIQGKPLIIPNVMYGTTDLTPGVSNLATGQLYFVYE